MIDKKMAIGIFDSGVGGLTVFKAIKELMPAESVVYLGDTARVPYGPKSSETIIRYSLENSDFLKKREVKAIVAACNTSSACAIPSLKEQNSLPIMGVIEPGVKAALAKTKNHNIGVIGTDSTIQSNRYAQGIKKLSPNAKVVSLPCPLFVPLVEEGWVDNDITKSIAEKYLSTMKSESIDTLILGCTHYPHLKKIISEVMGDDVALVDSAESLAFDLKEMLISKDLLADNGDRVEDHIYVTDLPSKFEITLKRFLGEDHPPVKRIEL